MLHEQGIVRVHTDIRIGSRLVALFYETFFFLFLLCDSGLRSGSRTDKTENFRDKVISVENHLAQDGK